MATGIKVPKILQNRVVVLISFIIIFASADYFYLPWNESVNNSLLDLQLKIRGNRSISDDIAIVFIGDDDVKAIGSWPITRDYYGYFIYAAHTFGASIIAIDVLFAHPNEDHPEYDAALAELIQSSGNVCLPMIFSELIITGNENIQDSSSIYFGLNPINTFERFRRTAIGTGFSNLSTTGVIRKSPMIINSAEGIIPSFGLEAARLFLSPASSIEFKERNVILIEKDKIVRKIPVDNKAEIVLNPFGDLENIKAYHFLDVLKTFEENPENLLFNNKLVFLIVSASGISNIHSTPLSEVFPASLVHIAVAENIISQNYLVKIPPLIQILLIGFMILLAQLTWTWPRHYWQVIVGVSLPILLLIISQIILTNWNTIIPVLYPLSGYLVVLFYFSGQNFLKQRAEQDSIKKMMKLEIQLKERKLEKIQGLLKQESETTEKSIEKIELQKETIRQLQKELSDLKSYVIPELETMKLEFSEIIYTENSPMAKVLDLVGKVAMDDIPVLILGETGTGKELVARAIHKNGERKENPFIAINCGALSETLLESELFGHEKGAFTGANNQRKGRFELANGGTIFLDEISETSPVFQTKLLRILQEGVFERVGGEQSIHVDIRVIAATNKQLDLQISNHKFRSDLYYRLNGFSISLPPLRERIDDIPMLVSYFLKKYEHDSVVEISDRAMNELKIYTWPGNVRELENTIRRAAILAKSAGRRIIQIEDLPKDQMHESSIFVHTTLEEQILKLLRSLEFSRSAISQTAKALGNKDRGTITEYFRGICFEKLVATNFDIELTAKEIAGSNSEEVIERVRRKLMTYLDNLKSSDLDEGLKSSVYKGLPQKFHASLDHIIKHFQEA